MQNKKNKTNNEAALTAREQKEMFEEMRAKVVEQELSARSWKAYYEKMYYSMEAEKIEPLYREYQERTQKRIEEEREKFEAFRKKLEEEIGQQNAEDPVGEIALEEVH